MTHPGGHERTQNSSSKELQTSPGPVKVSDHDSAITKRLGKKGIHGRAPRQNALLIKTNTNACLTKKHLDDLPREKYSVETKTELFKSEFCYIWHRNIRSAVQHDGGSVTVRGCFGTWTTRCKWWNPEFGSQHGVNWRCLVKICT